MRVLDAGCKTTSSAFTAKRTKATLHPTFYSNPARFVPRTVSPSSSGAGVAHIRCQASQDDAIPNDDVAPKQTPGSSTTVEEASNALQAFFNSLKDEEGLQEFMSWVPDAALDALIAVKKRIG